MFDFNNLFVNSLYFFNEMEGRKKLYIFINVKISIFFLFRYYLVVVIFFEKNLVVMKLLCEWYLEVF